MLTYQPARSDQYDELFQLMAMDATDYLQDSLRLMQMTQAQFAEIFRTVGNVFAIDQDGSLAGFYWIEERGQIVHLHALILKAAFQGQGIGTQALKMLIELYQGRMDAIELGVHQSNERARKLYQRLGFEDVKFLDDLGYYIMQKRLQKSPMDSVAHR